MIKQIIDEIAAEGSTKLKMVILAKYKDNELLKRALYLASSPRIKFYIKQIPEYTPESITPLFELEQALELLNDFSSRVVTGGAASSRLAYILAAVSVRDAEIIKKIIGKDLKMNMGGNINKVIPDLIEETPYQGAKSYSLKLAKAFFEKGKSCYGDVKMDGRYNNAIICDGEVECVSRQGESVILDDAKFIKELALFPNCVLNGELTIQGEPNRMKANGIVTSLIDITKKRDSRTTQETEKKIKNFEEENGCTFQEMLDRVEYTIWDTISIEEYQIAKSDIPYEQRWNNLLNILKENNYQMVNAVCKKELFSFDEAMMFFQECLNNGLEGIILKSKDGKWKDGKPNYQVKLKLEMDVDLEIVGFNYGTKGTKNEKVISSLICKSLDGILTTEPGGMDEKTMLEVTNSQKQLLGKIVHVKCCGITQANGKYSLLHPRVGDQKFRDDKTIADTFQQIKDNEDMCKGLK